MHHGFCKLCKKSFDTANLGIAGLKSHMKSKQHINLMKQNKKSFQQYIAKFFIQNRGFVSFCSETSKGALSSIIVEHNDDIATSSNTSLIVPDDVLHANFGF